MSEITLSMMRESLYAAVVADALDSMGLRNQSPRIRLTPYSSDSVLVGRCKTTLWVDMYHEVPNPYELELQAVDSCTIDSVMVCAAHGSMHSALWGELLSTASRHSGCIGAIIDGAVRDVRKIKQMDFPVFARDQRLRQPKPSTRDRLGYPDRNWWGSLLPWRSCLRRH